ncbi:hypothetical protein E2C01_051474 [Portunus trituberculatus]|uniref:Uncharacterized protein n=1 Tax=Portunus trituberculatus TaxID=210409 RepID=A0A5B7GJ86_PORTR|nr:hypothetical protein [Portunus trituberculatus]
MTLRETSAPFLIESLAGAVGRGGQRGDGYSNRRRGQSAPEMSSEVGVHVICPISGPSWRPCDPLDTRDCDPLRAISPREAQEAFAYVMMVSAASASTAGQMQLY